MRKTSRRADVVTLLGDIQKSLKTFGMPSKLVNGQKRRLGQQGIGLTMANSIGTAVTNLKIAAGRSVKGHKIGLTYDARHDRCN